MWVEEEHPDGENLSLSCLNGGSMIGDFHSFITIKFTHLLAYLNKK